MNTELDRCEAEPMSIAEQIAAINLKAEAEHEAVELKRRQLIEHACSLCEHEWGSPPEIIPGHTPVGSYCHKCETWEPFKRLADMSTPST